jgi:hypothetical protein
MRSASGHAADSGSTPKCAPKRHLQRLHATLPALFSCRAHCVYVVADSRSCGRSVTFAQPLDVGDRKC